MKSFQFIGLLVVCGGLSAYAQIPGVIRQVDDVQQRQQLQQSANTMIASNAAPELYSSETSDVGPQTVLQYRRHQDFEAFVDEQYFYCDNVFENDSGRISSDVLVSTVNVAYTPAPVSFAGGTLAPRAGYEHEWYMYGLAGRQSVVSSAPSSSFIPYSVTIGHFDFNVARPFADLTWKRDNWTGTFGMDARWLLDSGTYDEFYHEFVPNWTFGYTFPVCDRASLYVGYQGDYRFTWTYNPPALGGFPAYNNEFNDRTDQGILVAGTWWLCSHAALQPYYRFQYTCYSEIKRHDRLHTVGVTLILPITKNVIIRGFVTYDNLNTDGLLEQNFSNLNAGGGFNLSLSF